MGDGSDTAAIAAEDQELAATRHLARCARRFWAALTTREPHDDGDDLPDDLAEWAFRVWWADFINPDLDAEDLS